MADQSSNFRVVDRRSFSADGTRREGVEKESVETEAGSSAPAQSQPGAAQPSQTTTRQSARPSARQQATKAPPVPDESDLDELAAESDSGFGMLVSYLSTTAMFQLGLLPGPGGEHIPSDLNNARRTIELLEVLREKTQGNLTASEQRLLDSALYELQLSYVEVNRRLSQRPK